MSKTEFVSAIVGPPQENKTRIILSAFYHFDTGLNRATVMQIQPLTDGLITHTSRITYEPAGRSYIIRKINPIFNFDAIATNLQLIEKAQEKSSDQIPSYWCPVKFYNSKESGWKVYRDSAGRGWVLMDYIGGEVYNAADEIPQTDRPDAAYSIGAGIAIFEHIMSAIPEESWRKTLPLHREMDYHISYLDSVLAGQQVVLNLHREPIIVQKSEALTAKYQDRISDLLNTIKHYKYLSKYENDLGSYFIHDDLKINNLIFRRLENKKLFVVSLVDLDTIGVGPALIDIADAIRSTGNPAGENPENIDSVDINILIIDRIIDGYLDKTSEYGLRSLPDDIRIRIYKECQKLLFMLGIRFFADALIGNKYFKVKTGEPEDLNLFLAEVQFKALERLEANKTMY